MDLVYTKKKALVVMCALCLLGAFSSSVCAGLFPFLPNKSISSEQYSKHENQIEVYNQQAVELFEDGHFEEAQKLWEKAIQIMERSGEEAVAPHDFEDEQEDVEAYLSVDTQKYKSGQSEHENLYESAVGLFRRQKYVAAKKIFNRLERRIPDYKATRNYLVILEHKIKQMQQALSDNKLRESAAYRNEEREEWQRILRESEQELRNKLEEQASPLYKEALAHYKSRKFTVAKDYFQEINGVVPNYKDTAKYLDRIDVDIRSEDQRVLKERYKKEALERKREQEKWQQVIEESEQQLKEKMKAQAEPIYTEAVHYYKKRQFELAKSRFQEVSWILPEYKSVAKYLEHIDQDIEDEEDRLQRQKIRELARQSREEDLVRKREEKRLARLESSEEKKRLAQFRKEMAVRREERQEWLKVLKESEHERKRNLTEQADFVYREAISLYKDKEFSKAREDFLEVERIFPGYKSTNKYLAKIDFDIEHQQREEVAREQKMFIEQVRSERLVDRQQLAEEKKIREKENQRRLEELRKNALARKSLRHQWDKVLKKNERERKKRLNREAGFIYSEATRFYKNEDWESARDAFLEVQEVVPGYKRSAKYLKLIDTNIEKEEQQRKIALRRADEDQRQKENALLQKQEDQRRKLLERDQKEGMRENQKQAEAIYKFAVSLYKRGDYVQAKDKFLETEEIYPGYKLSGRYLARIDDDIDRAREDYRYDQQLAFQRQTREHKIEEQKRQKGRAKQLKAEEERHRKKLKKESQEREKERREWEKTINQIEAENQKRLRRQAELIYQEAVRYYDAGWFKQAKETFIEVEEVIPDYKSTGKYLRKADKRIEEQGKLYATNKQKIRDYAEESVKRDDARAFMPAQIPSVERETKKRKETLRKEAEEIYKEALVFYKRNQFMEAKFKFIEVESLLPGYKLTLKYLRNIDAEITNQNQFPSGMVSNSSIDRVDLVEQALLQYEKNRGPGQAIPGVTDQEFLVRDGLVHPEDSLKARKKKFVWQRKEAHRRYDKEVHSLYKEGVRLYRSKAYNEARDIFLRIEKMKPGYKRAKTYLKKANKKIQKGESKDYRTASAQSRKLKERSRIIKESLDVFEQKL